MNHLTKVLLSCLTALWLSPAAVLAQSPASSLIYVNASAGGNDDGTSWANAYTDLQDAIAAATSGDEIWVAADTYKPSAFPPDCSGCANPRDYTFFMKDSVSLYGGFDGTETQLSQRDVEANTTVLSGDFNDDDIVTGTGSTLNIFNNGENANRVILIGYKDNIKIDGFTIKGGHANINKDIFTGIDVSFSVSQNNGGGICIVGSSNITFSNINLTANMSTNEGGGLIIDVCSNINIFNSSVSRNLGGFLGGGIYSFFSDNARLVNSTLSGNAVIASGGGLYNSGGDWTLTNSIFWDNSISGFDNIEEADISNGGNITVTHSLTQENSIFSNGTDIINNQAPLFTNAANGDFTLQLGSPAINTGSNTAYQNATGIDPVNDIDLNGNPRIFGSSIDMGAYERELPCPPSYVLYVDANATGNNTGISWSNAYTNLQSALESTCPNITEIWVAAGTYKPSAYPLGCSGCSSPRDYTFLLKDGVKLYGGFAGTETMLSERNLGSNTTILSGDIGTTGDVADNAHHVVLAVFGSATPTTHLDGFSITGGNANGTSFITVNGANIFRVEGAGLFALNGTNGIMNNKVYGNLATGGSGGGIYLLNGVNTVANNSFYANSAFDGGGIYLGGLGINTLANNSISGNSGAAGGGLFTASGTNTLVNNIIWGNSGASIFNDPFLPSTNTVTYSIVQGGVAGEGNLDMNPQFTDAANGDFSLPFSSPAVNTGDPNTNLNLFSDGATVPLDLAGNPRVVYDIIDMGAFEDQTTACPTGTVLYVNANATGAGLGTSWANAYTSLQDALNNLCPGITEIWVAQGTYYPDDGVGQTNNSRNASFQLKSGVALYGGFIGNETQLSERDWEMNTTILSGDINQSNTLAGNSITVVIGSGTDNTAIIDGFTITAGNAEGLNEANELNEWDSGGGMFNSNGSPTITNCSFLGNEAFFYGAGMCNINNSSPTITNCIFSDNVATSGLGGGMASFISNPTLINCTFSRNQAHDGGGGVLNIANSPTITNCTFLENTAGNGGAIYNDQCSPIITNCTLSENTATSQGGAIYNGFTSPTPTFTNTIVWNNSANGSTTSASASVFNFNENANPTFNHSLIGNSGGSGSWDTSIGTDGGNNIDADPQFTDAANGDFSIPLGSPAINTGDPTTDLNLFLDGATAPLDLAGNPRVVNDIIDMGVFEDQTACTTGAVLYVNANATGDNSSTSWANAYTSLQDALNNLCPEITEIWVAQGTYYPDEGAGITDNNRDATFQLNSGVALYGGFIGNETQLPERDWENNLTILSGDINQSDTFAENSYSVVIGSGTDNTAIIDGFIITAGNANEVARFNGGGMLNSNGSPTVTNCTFSGNSAALRGGGMYNIESSPRLTNTTFSGNSAAEDGGGMYNTESSPTLTNCTFSGNTAGIFGGGMLNIESSPTLTNTIFSGNTTGTFGGGMFNVLSNTTLTNCIIWNNSAAGSMASASASVFNASPNSEFSHSLIANSGGSGSWDSAIGTDGGNNIAADPLFVAPLAPGLNTGGDYRLQACSPAINAGSNAAVPMGVTTDLDGNGRFFNNGIVDMGAYEFQGEEIADNENPIAICPTTTPTVVLDGNGNGTLAENALASGNSTDNCNVTETSPMTGFTCADAPSATVVLTATDAAGNSSTANCTVNIVDNEAPVALCQNLTVQLDANGSISIIPQDVDNGSSDACGIQSLSLSRTDFGCADVGNNTVTLTATDANTNMGTCSATVNVTDNNTPTAVCDNQTVNLTGDGITTVAAAFFDGGSSAVCGGLDFSASMTAFDCDDVGEAYTVTLTVTSQSSGLSDQCTSTVTVEDPSSFCCAPPMAACDNITVQLDAGGNGSTTAGAVDNGSNDACGVASLSLSQTSFGCAEVGANTETLTVTDVNGNVSTCSTTVTVEDNVAPAALCQNVTVQLDANGSGSTTAGAVDNGSNDACGVASLSLSQTSFGCAEVGANTETLTVTDVNGNVSTCSTTVTVEDNVAPAALCQNVTVQLDANGNGSTTAVDVDNGSNDACGVASLSLSQTSFGCAEVGANTETLTVTDVNGNVSTCSTTVTVEDNVAPTALCQNVTVQLDANGNGSTTAGAVDNGSNDACGVASLSLSQTSFGCAEVGANTETLTVTDVNGNVSTCSTTVTVEDNVAPAALCQNVTVQLDANGSGSTTAGAVDNGSNDACGVASLSFSQTSFGCAEVGANTETLTVTDVNGNVSTCSTTVTVEDNVAPAALCQNVTVQLDANGSGSTTAVDVDNGSNDACGVASLSLSQTSFGCAEVGANTETLTVTDVNGNVSTCSTTVTVEDNVAPTALCQNLTVQLDANGNSSITPQDVDNGSSDACGIGGLSVSPGTFGCGNTGGNTVTLTVTDVNTNTASCTATVTVEDNIDPTAACLNTTVEIQPDGFYDLQQSDVYDATNSSDNCSIASVSFPATTFGCDDLDLTFPVMVTVTDPSGNTDDCTANVSVVAGTALPPEWSANDIGNQGSGSDYAYDPCAGNNPSNGDFTISTGGYNLIPQNSDNVAFSSVPLCGNGGIQARIKDVVGGYAGLMIRESSAPGAKMFAVYSNLTNLLRREIRTVENGQRSSNTFFASFPQWLRLVRQGNYIQAFYRNSNGGNWTLFHQAYLPMGNCVEMGLAVFTTDPSGDASAVFGKVNYLSQGGQSLSTPNTLSWEAETPEVQSASVLPNPVRGNFTLQFSKPLSTAGQATLLNEFGQRIAQQPLRAGERQVDWDAGALPAGLYFLEVATADGYREVLKVVRQ